MEPALGPIGTALQAPHPTMPASIPPCPLEVDHSLTPLELKEIRENIANGQYVQKTYRPSATTRNLRAIAPQGDKVIVWDHSNCVTAWDIEQQVTLWRFQLGNHISTGQYSNCKLIPVDTGEIIGSYHDDAFILKDGECIKSFKKFGPFSHVLVANQRIFNIEDGRGRKLSHIQEWDLRGEKVREIDISNYSKDNLRNGKISKSYLSILFKDGLFLFNLKTNDTKFIPLTHEMIATATDENNFVFASKTDINIINLDSGATSSFKIKGTVGSLHIHEHYIYFALSKGQLSELKRHDLRSGETVLIKDLGYYGSTNFSIDVKNDFLIVNDYSPFSSFDIPVYKIEVQFYDFQTNAAIGKGEVFVDFEKERSFEDGKLLIPDMQKGEFTVRDYRTKRNPHLPRL